MLHITHISLLFYDHGFLFTDHKRHPKPKPLDSSRACRKLRLAQRRGKRSSSVRSRSLVFLAFCFRHLYTMKNTTSWTFFYSKLYPISFHCVCSSIIILHSNNRRCPCLIWLTLQASLLRIQEVELKAAEEAQLRAQKEQVRAFGTSLLLQILKRCHRLHFPGTWTGSPPSLSNENFGWRNGGICEEASSRA